MSMIKRKPLKFGKSRTFQSFRDSADINKILSRAQETGTISHLAKHEAFYGDFAAFDFQEAQNMLAKGRQIFDDLPSEIRREFHQDPREFFEYVNDPANAEDLANKLPGLAEPGRQHITVDTQAAAAAGASPAPEPAADVPPASEPEPAPTPPEGG